MEGESRSPGFEYVIHGNRRFVRRFDGPYMAQHTIS